MNFGHYSPDNHHGTDVVYWRQWRYRELA